MKKEFRYFSIFNHEEEQEYLREQHKQGWKFHHVSGLGTYHFIKCEPEDVIYQLDYNQESSKNKDEYIKMFSDCGWEYIQDFAEFSYFRKPVAEMNEEEGIFCDESSRLAMLERVYKGRMIPVLVIFITCVLPQFIINVQNSRYGLATIFGIILGGYAFLFAYCAIHYYKKKNKY